MCMRFAFAGPESPTGGVPLNEDTFSEMGHVEADFWKGMLGQATVEVGQAEDATLSQPYKPSETLSVMYRRAVNDFNGKIYRQVRRLEEIFNFE